MRTRHAFRPTLDGNLEARLCLSRPAAPMADTPVRPAPEKLEATEAAERLEATRAVAEGLEAARAAESRLRERIRELGAQIERLGLKDRAEPGERSKLDALKDLAGEDRLRSPLDPLRAVDPAPAKPPTAR